MIPPAKSFRDLIVWQKAHEFVLRTYDLTKQFPREELYCLVPQMRRAAISIPANIAEGFKKRGFADKNRFFNTSQGSWKNPATISFLAKILVTVTPRHWSRFLRTFPVYSLRIHNPWNGMLPEGETRPPSAAAQAGRETVTRSLNSLNSFSHLLPIRDHHVCWRRRQHVNHVGVHL
jgi:four helix bundle protein